MLVEMDMSDQAWHEVKNTPSVTGFVGGGNSPVPLTADEVDSILFRQATSAERPRPKVNFETGETVRINDGPFANFSGIVDEINPERNTLRVMVTFSAARHRWNWISYRWKSLRKVEVDRGDYGEKITVVKLQIPAGKATPAPPVGTALGPAGRQHHGVLQDFNAKTRPRTRKG